MVDFLHLRVHSAYSLAQGAIHMKKIPSLCLEHKMPAIALTDTNNLFGALEFSTVCADAGIQPIIGCQVDFDISSLFPQTKNTIPPSPFILLAQNEEGYQNLLKLVSHMYLKDKESVEPFLIFEDLKNYNAGLLCLTGGHDGPLGQLLLNDDKDNALTLLSMLNACFKDRLYIEIQRHGLQEEEKIEPALLEFALSTQLPIVATNNVFFSKPSMYEAHDALLCIAEGTYVEETNRKKVTPSHYFKSQQEMINTFSDLPEAIENTVLIAKRCSYRPLSRKPILPRFTTDSGHTETQELFEKAHEGLEKRLEQEVFRLNAQIPQEEIRTKYQERLRYELQIIERMGFPGYFLIVSDFIKWAKSQRIPVGPGRGSGAGSLVAWALTITDMDPIRFQLLFERFLNPERVSMPDFDVDFCQDRRDEVIHYVLKKYGTNRVAHIITFGKLQARAVIRDVGRVLQMPYTQVDRICKLIPNNPANPTTLEQALELEPALKQQKKEEPIVGKLIDMGIQLEGLYRHASTHAAGVVIGDRPLDELIPLYRDEKSELPVTQFNMKYAEMAGLVKFDFLGLKTLTVIEYCCELIRKSKGLDFSIQSIPLDDPATFALLCRVEAVGIFQLESAGMRDVLRKLQPDRFEDLIALVALYRPGPMDDIPRYLACKHGQEPVTYLHPALQPILEATYGVMVYQEQVMQIAQTLGGYTLGAADLLRRAMGKKIKEEMDAQRALFTEGAIKNGVKPDIASQIFDQMAKFAGYGFNKSHSAPYALLAYQTAYLKANHPLEFFAATMTYDMHNIDKLNVYIQDLERLNIKLLPPDVNFSDVNFKVEGNGVRYALAAIKNVGAQAMETMIEERNKKGPFKSLNDFALRIDPRVLNKRQCENLIASGAFDNLHSNRKQILEGLDVILAKAQQSRLEKSSKQGLLFGGLSSSKEEELRLPPCVDWNPLERLQKEFEALGFYLSAHPLDMYKDILQNLGVINSTQLQEVATQQQQSVSLAGIILAKQERTSKTGQKFAFVSLTDTHGVFEVAFFSETYMKIRELLVVGDAVYVTGLLRLDGESIRLTGQSLELLNSKSVMNELVVRLSQKTSIHTLKQIIENFKPGKTILHLDVEGIVDQKCIRLTFNKRFYITPAQRAELLMHTQ